MSADSEIRESIERLKQTIRDARRLKKELASQLRELDEKLKGNKAATSKSKKTRARFPFPIAFAVAFSPPPPDA